MKMNVKALLIFIGVVILAILVAGPGLQMLSTIGQQRDANPSCDITNAPGECAIEYTLEEGRALTEFVLTVGTQAVPEDEYSDYMRVQPFATGGPYVREKNDNEPQTYNIYLYRMPSSYVNPYEIMVRADSFVSASVTNDAAYAKGEITVFNRWSAYPHSSVIYCNKEYVRDCANRNDVVVYAQSSRGYPDVDLYRMIRLSSAIKVNVKSRKVAEPANEMASYQGVITNVELQDIPKEQFLIAVWTEKEEELDNYATVTMSTPDVYMKYRKSSYPTNLKYGIGGDWYETKSGEVKEEFMTLNIANQINDYCGRNRDPKEVGECTFDLQFESSANGKVVILNEESTLEIATGDTTKYGVQTDMEEELIDEEYPIIEQPAPGAPTTSSFNYRFTFDYVNDSTNAYITIGMLVAAVIVAIFLLPIGGKKR